jgi:hypothetical protein
MSTKEPKPTPADPPTTSSPSDLPDGFRMVEVEPGRWIGLPTFDINEWFDFCEIPLEERAGILERGGGYDGFQVSADLERETFKWLLEHGRPAASARTPLVSDETMAEVARRFGKKPLMDKAVREHLRRLDIRDELQRQAEVKAWGQPETKPVDVNGQPDSDGERKGIGFPGTPVVFISSTSEDLKDYREKARDAALLAGFMPRMMEYFAASGSNPPLRACLEKVSGSPIEPPADVLVLIVAHRYGWVPKDQSGSERKSITWLECEQAQQNGCEVLAFVVDKDHPWPDGLREEHQIAREASKGTGTPELLAEVQSNVAGLKQFKRWIDDLALRATFTTPDSLHGQVVAALNEWRRRHVEWRPSMADCAEPG